MIENFVVIDKEIEKCEYCPLSQIDQDCKFGNSAYDKTTDAKDIWKFIVNAEKYMIPALRQAKKYCLKREKND